MTVACPLCGAGGIRHLHERPFQNVVWKLAHCRSCGLRFTDPTPTDEQLRSFYSGDFHAPLRIPGAAEAMFSERFRRYVDWIVEFVPGGRALDVGCATGFLPWMLRQKGFDVEGIELHPDSARWGAEHYGIPIACGTLELVAPQAESYDLIVLTEIVEHTRQPLEFLRAVRPLLKAGGYALVTFPDITAAKSRYYRWISKLTGREDFWITCHMPFHTWEFTPRTAAATFSKAGFSIAGFRRTETAKGLPGNFARLSWPARLLTLGPVARHFGSQMEFMIRKNG